LQAKQLESIPGSNPGQGAKDKSIFQTIIYGGKY